MTIMNRHTSSCACQEATKLTSESNSFGEQLVQLGAMFSLFTRIRHRRVLFMHDQSTSFMTRRKTELASTN